MNQRGRLFKFSGPSPHALQNLEKGQIFCQHYSAYNDPFEFWTSISEGIPVADIEPERYLAALQAWGFNCSTIAEANNDSIIQDSVEEYFNECRQYAPDFEAMKQETRISCFSSEANNLLMWSHYGDGLRGFCIAFDEDALMRAAPAGYVLDVAYLNAPPQVDSFVYGVAQDQDWYSHTAIEETETAIKYQGRLGLEGEIARYKQSGKAALATMREIWQLVFATKPAEWMYERERRILIETDKKGVEPFLLEYGNNVISEVVIGERMPEDYRSRVLAVMKQRYPEVSVRTARRALGTYTIKID